jgi:hypothetical protein
MYREGMKWGWRQAVIFAAVLAGAVAAAERQPEELPRGVRLLRDDRSRELRGDTLGELKQRAKPDLSWTEPDPLGETPVFVWITQSPDRQRVSFTFDVPHRVKRNGETFWALLDATSRDTENWGSEISDFFVLQFVRERIDFPQDPVGDVNQSHVRLLAENERGGRVFEIVYCSTVGYRANWEGMKTYLIYASPDGKYFQASEDMGHQGNSPYKGVMGIWSSLEFKVKWQRDGAAEPFEIEVRGRAVYSANLEEGPDYYCVREGTLSGPLPMRPQWQPHHFAQSDGTLSLRKLADTLTFFFSDWHDSYWIEPAERPRVKEEITRAWLDELRRINRDVGPDDVLPKGRRVTAVENEYRFNDALFERVRARMQEKKL